MFRTRAAISAAALTLSISAFAPLAAGAASVLVSATVASTARFSAAATGATGTISSTTSGATSAWTGATALAVPFTVTVQSNDASGYKFTFTGTNAPAFEMIGTSVPGNVVHYTVSGTGADTTAYTSGVIGSYNYGGSTQLGDTTTTFDVGLPGTGFVPPDTYTDALTVVITPT